MENDPKPKRHLTVSEAAAYLCVGEKDIRAYIANGELRAWTKTINHAARARARIQVEDLDAFVRSRRIVPKAPVVVSRYRSRRFRDIDCL